MTDKTRSELCDKRKAIYTRLETELECIVFSSFGGAFEGLEWGSLDYFNSEQIYKDLQCEYNNKDMELLYKLVQEIEAIEAEL